MGRSLSYKFYNYFSSYFRRTQALGHKQYVKKIDHLPVIKYLTSSCEKMAPFNVRKKEDLKKRQIADGKEALEGKNFFTDREAISDDDMVIPNDLVSGELQHQYPPRIDDRPLLKKKNINSKVEKIFKGSLVLIPSSSPSVKIQIMGGKVWL